MKLFKALIDAPQMRHPVQLMAQASGSRTRLSAVRAMQARDSPLRDARAARNSRLRRCAPEFGSQPSADIEAASPCAPCALDSSAVLS